MKLYSLILLSIISTLIFIGCSGSGDNPVTPPANAVSLFTEREADSGRVLFGVWQICFDPIEMTATVSPLRNVELHFNITEDILPPNCDDCLDWDIQSFDPVTWITDVNVTLRNQLQFDGYDVRGILFTDDLGTELTNPDDWTGLWDIEGGDYINPFKAFAKEEPQRKFAIGAEYNEEYLIYSPPSENDLIILFAVDASWPENCGEPYFIKKNSQTVIDNTAGSEGWLELEVRDWQDDINDVFLFTPTEMGMETHPFENQGEGIWAGNITNILGAGPGDYDALVIAISPDLNTNSLYDFVPITITESAPSGRWARTCGGESTDKGQKTAIDGEGNIYAYGDFCGIADFNPGHKVHNRTSHPPKSEGDDDVDFFLSKFDPSGILQWVRTWDGAEDHGSRGLAVNEMGSVYVTGSFRGEVDLDPGPDESLHTSYGNADVFLIKFDTNGTFQWVQTWGGPYSEGGRGVAIDDLGDVYVAGGTVVYIYPDDFENIDVYVRKFEPMSGDLLWEVTWGAGLQDAAMEVTTDSLGNVCVTGLFQGHVDFDPGPGIDMHYAAGELQYCRFHYDAFLSKFDSNGNFLWAGTWGGPGPEDEGNPLRIGWDKGLDVATDGYNNIYVTGYFSETGDGSSVDFDPGLGVDEHYSNGGMDAFLSKFDSEGDFIWVGTGGGHFGDWGRGVITDGDNNIYFTGGFAGSVDFDPGPGEDWHFSVSGDLPDVFLSKHEPSSIFLWARTWGSINGDIGRSVAVDAFGNSYVTGWFKGITDFDPGPGEDVQPYYDRSDIFLTKLTPDGD